MRYACAPWSAFLMVLLNCTVGSPPLHAHGNVVLEEDACVIRIGFYQAHFAVYQPGTSRHFEFCEDLPDATETIFVLEYLHESMREVPVDFRIVRDSLGLGRFARSDDLTRIDLDEDTVFYAPHRRQSDGVLTVLHTFPERGDYIGIVTARNPQEDKVYTAVFPFSVGAVPTFVSVILIGLAAALALILGFWLYRRIPAVRSRRVSTAALMVGFVLAGHSLSSDATDSVRSAEGHVIASFESESGTIDINRMHTWIVHLEHAGGGPVEQASIQVSGGMPEHDHGLPTSPRMTRYLGEGYYLVEGMKFHMNGHWEVVVSVETDAFDDVVTFDLEL